MAECTIGNNASTLQGVFWFIFQFSQILGNFFAAFILRSTKTQMIFFCILLAVALFSIFIFKLLPVPTRVVSPDEDVPFYSGPNFNPRKSSASEATTENSDRPLDNQQSHAPPAPNTMNVRTK